MKEEDQKLLLKEAFEAGESYQRTKQTTSHPDFVDWYRERFKPVTDENKPEELLSEGDTIEFDFHGTLERGKIQQVGKYGYWIAHGSSAHGSIRCPFDKAKLVCIGVTVERVARYLKENGIDADEEGKRGKEFVDNLIDKAFKEKGFVNKKKNES